VLHPVRPIAGIEHDAQHVGPDIFDEPDQLERGDLLVRLQVQVDAEVARDGRESAQELRRSH
jgi:hypothetical protein